MKSKKIVTLFMCLILISGLVGCGSNQQDRGSDSGSSEQQADAALLESEASETGTELEATDSDAQKDSATEAEETVAQPDSAAEAAENETGKTVVPFCTSASSGLGDSGNLLEEMAGTGNWLEGERFPSGVSEETVQEWVEGLGL